MSYIRDDYIIDDTMYGIPFEDWQTFLYSLTEDEAKEYLAAKIETQEQFEEFRKKVGK